MKCNQLPGNKCKYRRIIKVTNKMNSNSEGISSVLDPSDLTFNLIKFKSVTSNREAGSIIDATIDRLERNKTNRTRSDHARNTTELPTLCGGSNYASALISELDRFCNSSFYCTRKNFVSQERVEPPLEVEPAESINVTCDDDGMKRDDSEFHSVGDIAGFVYDFSEFRNGFNGNVVRSTKDDFRLVEMGDVEKSYETSMKLNFMRNADENTMDRIAKIRKQLNFSDGKRNLSLHKTEGKELRVSENDNNELLGSKIEIHNSELERNEIQNNEMERNEIHNNEIERNELHACETERNEIHGSKTERNEIHGNETEKSEIIGSKTNKRKHVSKTVRKVMPRNKWLTKNTKGEEMREGQTEVNEMHEPSVFKSSDAKELKSVDKRRKSRLTKNPGSVMSLRNSKQKTNETENIRLENVQADTCETSKHEKSDNKIVKVNNNIEKLHSIIIEDMHNIDVIKQQNNSPDPQNKITERNNLSPDKCLLDSKLRKEVVVCLERIPIEKPLRENVNLTQNKSETLLNNLNVEKKSRGKRTSKNVGNIEANNGRENVNSENDVENQIGTDNVKCDNEVNGKIDEVNKRGTRKRKNALEINGASLRRTKRITKTTNSTNIESPKRNADKKTLKSKKLGTVNEQNNTDKTDKNVCIQNEQNKKKSLVNEQTNFKSPKRNTNRKTLKSKKLSTVNEQNNMDNIDNKNMSKLNVENNMENKDTNKKVSLVSQPQKIKSPKRNTNRKTLKSKKISTVNAQNTMENTTNKNMSILNEENKDTNKNTSLVKNAKIDSHNKYIKDTLSKFFHENVLDDQTTSKRTVKDNSINDVVFIAPSNRKTVLPLASSSRINSLTSSLSPVKRQTISGNYSNAKELTYFDLNKSTRPASPLKKNKVVSIGDPSKMKKRKKKQNQDLDNSSIERPNVKSGETSNGMKKRKMFSMEDYVNSNEFLGTIDSNEKG